MLPDARTQKALVRRPQGDQPILRSGVDVSGMGRVRRTRPVKERTGHPR